MSNDIATIFREQAEYKKINHLVHSSKHINLNKEENLERIINRLESLHKEGLLVVKVQEFLSYLKSLQEQLKDEFTLLSKYQERYNDLLDISSEYPDFIGCSEAIRNICRQIGIVAKSDSSVLIQGESGTGKEVVARTVHNHSKQCKFPFVSVNCAAIPESLLESELFGNVKGAFTGAVRDYPGKLKQAHGGTFLFDEICSMSLGGQAKLLRVLQEREFQPVGGLNTIKFDARIVATSNVNLLDQVKENQFREDLYYRLNVFPIYIPPLRERKEDILPLSRHFLHKYSTALNKNISDFDPRTTATLIEHDWPGNVRELANCIEYSMIVEKSKVVKPSSLPNRFSGNFRQEEEINHDQKTLRGKLAIFEREIILKSLEQTNWVKKDAAVLLGIDPKNINYYLVKNNISEYCY